MGPLVQIMFVFIIAYYRIITESYFYNYHWFILLFNLLPIYPLDGGRLLNLILAYFFAYYQSLKVVLYLSYSLYLFLLFFTLLWKKNLILFMILSLIGIKMIKEIKQADYYFQKFLIERYLNHYLFTKSKKIIDIKQMRRDYYHYFLKDKSIISESEQLRTYFS